MYVEVTETYYLVCDDAYIQNLNLVKQLSFVVFPSNGKYQTFTDGDELQLSNPHQFLKLLLLPCCIQIKKMGEIEDTEIQSDIPLIKSLIV